MYTRTLTDGMIANEEEEMEIIDIFEEECEDGPRIQIKFMKVVS